MLQRRLTGALLATVAAATLAGCGDEPIEDHLVRPGITAIDDARSEACGLNASTLRLAIESYTLLEGEPPRDEQALVDAGFLREPTDDWNVVDGALIAQNPACGEVGETATSPTAVDIITDASVEPMTADEILAGMSDDQIEGVGGIECASELAAIISAAERFVDELERDPADFADLVDAGFLDSMPVLWLAEADRLRPAADGNCTDLG